MTRFESYQEALRFLGEAEDAIDQAHAQMKDCGCEDVDIRVGSGYVNIRTLSLHSAKLLKELETAECSECFHPLSQHGDRNGCEYERGDVPMRCKDGGDVMAAAGPCGCGWGKEVSA